MPVRMLGKDIGCIAINRLQQLAGKSPIVETLPSKQDSFFDQLAFDTRSSDACSMQDEDSLKDFPFQSTDITGCSFAGILYKWTNFRDRWRPRWFILHDGVLSYYEIHGPERISITSQEQREFFIIGDASIEYVRKQKGIGSQTSNRKVLGALHLKISTLRKSKSDDKRFYIFTGTKTLKLRVDKPEDKKVWLESLQASIRDQLLPKVECDAPSISLQKEICISTKNVRAYLLEKGLCSTAVHECEKIVLSEFAEMQGELKVLQNNYASLVEKLKLMEAESAQREATIVDEKHACVHEEENHINSIGNIDHTPCESEQCVHKTIAAPEEDETFYDTQDILWCCKQRDSIDSVCDFEDVCLKSHCTADPNMDLVGFNYPYVKRRKKLPEPKEKEKGVSLWSLIKDNIGRDLTRICLPVFFNEPLSSLQKCFEDLEYSYLLDRAYQWGKQGNTLMRLLNVAAFAISGYASTEERTCKPFNPLLGETYEAEFPDKGLKFISEKVSHHPMIVACHCEGNGWKFWGDSNVKSKFWGQSIQLDPVGILTLEFEDGEVFQWSKVTTSIYNLILGKIYCDHYGTMRIQGNQGLSCRLTFKEQSIIDRNPHQVHGFVLDKVGNKLASLIGKWDESIYFVDGDIGAKPKGFDPIVEGTKLWERCKPSKYSTRYNLTSFAMQLNEITPGLKEKLPPTDSRLRPDQRLLENGEYEAAFAEKLRLEEKQRMARKLQEIGWQPRWFRKQNDTSTYRYVGGYWEARKISHWKACPDIFGTKLPQISNGV